MNTRNTFIIAAVTASLAAVNTDAVCKAPLPAPKMDIPRTESHALKDRPDNLPAPGIYLSEPYLTVVIVPEDVDPAFEHRSDTDLGIDNSLVRPYTRLVPYNRVKDR